MRNPLGRMLGLCGLLSCLAPAGAVSLGELQLGSALGERFEAVIQVSGDEDDDLDQGCFSLVAVGQENNVRAIKRGHFVLRGQGERQQVVLHGNDVEHEPMVRVRIRYACPQAKHFFEREYTVLLDPRTATPTARPAVVPLNPIEVMQTPTPARPPALQASTRQTAAPVLRRGQRKAPVPATLARETGLRLQIAIAPPDLSKAPPLDEKSALAMRERLLLIEADDQAAQLLQLKDRLSQLEKQLDHVSALARVGDASKTPVIASPAPDPAAKKTASRPESAFTTWVWLGLLPLPFLWLWLRRQARIREEKFLGEIFPPSEMTLPVTELPPHQEAQSSLISAQTTPADWQKDDMDVVSPSNVNEEVQLLLDHGLAAQALILLVDEIRLRPSALAMWMRLFETCVVLGDRATFTAYAERFRSQFMSESLWGEVLALGAKLGLDSFANSESGPALLGGKAIPRGNDDFDLADYLLPAQSLDRSRPEQKRGALGLPPLVFSLDLDNKALGPVAQRDDFQSDDPELAAISILLHQGKTTESYARLEQLLYSGSMEQRITASRWLDRLLPVKGQEG